MAAVLVGVASYGGARYASDLDDVTAAYNSFHQAIASLDITEIETLFAHDDALIYKEPRSKTIAGMNRAEGKLKSGKSTVADIADSDVVRKREGRWILVSHVAYVMQP